MNIRFEQVHPSDDEATCFIASEYLKMFLELNPNMRELYTAGEKGKYLSDAFIKDYIDQYIHNDSRIYAAYFNDEIVGALQFDNNEQLSCLFVKEEYRNQLIGSRLLNRLIRECNNLKLIKVDARIEAISLYERFSFRKVEGTSNKIFIPMELEMKKHEK